VCAILIVSNFPRKLTISSCIGAFRSPNCPNCRSRLNPDRVVKLHVDRVAESDEPDRLSLEAIHDQQLHIMFERETSDLQLQIVFERETAQAIEAELSGKCKRLEKYVLFWFFVR